MEDLRNVIINETGLSEDHYVQLLQLSCEVCLQKEDVLVREGETCSFIGFVEEGTLRSYMLRGGKEFNLDFYFPGSFISSYTSFLTQTPSKGFIEALDEVVIRSVSYSVFNNLLENSNDWFRLGKYISDTLFKKKCLRETSLLMDSAKQRYELLLKTYPGVEQDVPQYHIASYLGIQPESLSRMKSLTYIKEKG